MISKIFCIMLFIIQYLLATTQAFWWPTTTPEPPNMFKQIPLTYFRTYTYQPLAGNPLPLPYLSNNLMSDKVELPILNGMRYGALDNSLANLKSVYSSPIAPYLNKYHNFPATTTTRRPTTTRSTTTTTTTTTAAPTTSTTTKEYPMDMPMFNRRAFYNNYPIYQRQPYPYPNYQAYDNANYMDRQTGTNMPYMPCMCPLGMGIGMGVTNTDSTRSTPYTGQSRSTYKAETEQVLMDLELPKENKPLAFQKPEDEPRIVITEVPEIDITASANSMLKI